MRIPRILILLTLTALIAVPSYAAPDEQVALRSVANISRLALGCDPSQPGVDPEGTGWVLAKPPATYFDGGTPNQKMLVRVWHYGWALRTSSGELATARTTLLDFINRQQQAVSGGPFGHYATAAGANEELTSSHYQLWSGAMAAAYLIAITNTGTLNANSANTTPETLVRDAARKWWSDEKVLYDRTYTANKLDAPGARFPNTNFFGTNVLRDDIYKLLRNINPAKVRTCTSDKYYTSSFVLQAMRNIGIPVLGNPPAGYTPSPKLYDTLCVYRNGADWTLYFPVMRSVSDPLYWVEFRNGNYFYAGLPPLPIGKPQSYPPGTTVDTLPGVVASAATCPPPETLNQ